MLTQELLDSVPYVDPLLARLLPPMPAPLLSDRSGSLVSPSLADFEDRVTFEEANRALRSPDSQMTFDVQRRSSGAALIGAEDGVGPMGSVDDHMDGEDEEEDQVPARPSQMGRMSSEVGMLVQPNGACSSTADGHPPLMLDVLQKVLKSQKSSQSAARGARWNQIREALHSDLKQLDRATEQAKQEVMLLKRQSTAQHLKQVAAYEASATYNARLNRARKVNAQHRPRPRLEPSS